MLNQKIDAYAIQVTNITSQLHNQTPIIQDKEELKTCTFTRTFYYYQTLDFKGQVQEKYIVLGEFQGSQPIILRVEPDFDFVFEKSWYEFTFKGVDTFDGINTQQILSIKKTNKVGLDQIQESCNNN